MPADAFSSGWGRAGLSFADAWGGRGGCKAPAWGYGSPPEDVGREIAPAPCSNIEAEGGCKLEHIGMLWLQDPVQPALQACGDSTCTP